MKYTKEERMDIARRVYDKELTVEAAAIQYDLNPSSIKGYLRLYREANGLPTRIRKKQNGIPVQTINEKAASMAEYEAMSREELIDALVMAQINEARLKKGYLVKGSGVAKEFVPIDNKSTR